MKKHIQLSKQIGIQVLKAVVLVCNIYLKNQQNFFCKNMIFLLLAYCCSLSASKHRESVVLSFHKFTLIFNTSFFHCNNCNSLKVEKLNHLKVLNKIKHKFPTVITRLILNFIDSSTYVKVAKIILYHSFPLFVY